MSLREGTHRPASVTCNTRVRPQSTAGITREVGTDRTESGGPVAVGDPVTPRASLAGRSPGPVHRTVSAGSVPDRSPLDLPTIGLHRHGNDRPPPGAEPRHETVRRGVSGSGGAGLRSRQNYMMACSTTQS